VASRLVSPGKQLNQRVASPNKLEAGPQKRLPHGSRVAKVMACIRKKRLAELSKASPLQSTRTLRRTRRSAGARETGETDEDEVEKERLKQLLADLGDFKNASTFEMKHRVEAQDLRVDSEYFFMLIWGVRPGLSCRFLNRRKGSCNKQRKHGFLLLGLPITQGSTEHRAQTTDNRCWVIPPTRIALSRNAQAHAQRLSAA
jgi:hypothetical protein